MLDLLFHFALEEKKQTYKLDGWRKGGNKLPLRLRRNSGVNIRPRVTPVAAQAGYRGPVSRLTNTISSRESRQLGQHETCRAKISLRPHVCCFSQGA